jgi:hypothetical protein
VELECSWNAVEERLLEIAERRDTKTKPTAADELVSYFGLVEPNEDDLELTDAGMKLYEARFVLQSPAEITEALASVLRELPEVSAFCSALWGRLEVQVTGAVSLLRRITTSDSEPSAKRWLELMNRAGLISYNRSKPTLRVIFNPDELVPAAEGAEREKRRGHVLSPDRPFGNVLALRDLLDSARGWIRWYEQHLPPKVMEVLYKQIDGANVSEIRLLSGPANLNDEAKKDFKRFQNEMKKARGIDAEWRVLDKNTARDHHDRFFISEGQSKNLPPLNTILANSTGEILESQVSTGDFDAWWAKGEPLAKWTPPAPP